MELGIQGKIALVTGSTAGIGLAAAVSLAREGAEVVVNGRSAARVEEAVGKVREAVPGATVRGIAADLGTAQGAAELIAQLPEVHILINNMGVFEPVEFEQITDEAWMAIFETNVLSGVRLSRHYFPRMKAANWGRIIFVSSESAVQIPAEMIHYGVTKLAQVGVARGLAELTVGTGVTVNTVLPGPTWSEGVERFVEQLAEANGLSVEEQERDFFKSARPSSLIQRFASTEEVADMIAYVASQRASATNGAALRVEGGIVRAAL
jgi:NAD(P)-dependent dehydrogenase (short-subunit alcohol dehydrogenase family)